jgi:hypothetical protein
LIKAKRGCGAVGNRPNSRLAEKFWRSGAKRAKRAYFGVLLLASPVSKNQSRLAAPKGKRWRRSEKAACRLPLFPTLGPPVNRWRSGAKREILMSSSPPKVQGQGQSQPQFLPRRRGVWLCQRNGMKAPAGPALGRPRRSVLTARNKKAQFPEIAK